MGIGFFLPAGAGVVVGVDVGLSVGVGPGVDWGAGVPVVAEGTAAAAGATTSGTKGSLPAAESRLGIDGGTVARGGIVGGVAGTVAPGVMAAAGTDVPTDSSPPPNNTNQLRKTSTAAAPAARATFRRPASRARTALVLETSVLVTAVVGGVTG